MFEIENRHAPKNRKTNKINNKLQENTKKIINFRRSSSNHSIYNFIYIYYKTK